MAIDQRSVSASTARVRSVDGHELRLADHLWSPIRVNRRCRGNTTGLAADEHFQNKEELFGKHGATLQRYFLQGFVATVPIEFNHFREIAD